MRYSITVLVFVCIAALFVAGCTTPSSPPTPTPAVTVTAVPPVSPSAMGTSQPASDACTKDSDCAPATSCHPDRCTVAGNAGPSGVMCTAVCAGPLDCGAGSCGCVNNRCAVVPARHAQPIAVTSVSLRGSPQNYTPLMSSTPGIRLTVNTAGFNAADAMFVWNASYGEFFSWSAPDYVVSPHGNPVTNRGEPVYWSFTNRTSSTAKPVIITVVAKDPVSGSVLGSSQLNLIWNGDFAVTVQNP
jgi:hypothetical protein